MKAGPYEIEKEIGRGGAGIVFRGRGPDGREVALKLLRKISPQRVARFDRERRIHASLGEAEGFVPLVDSGETTSGPYLVMPFVAGGTLRDKLLRGPLPPSEALALGADLARALAFAHDRGIVHRDLKPESVLFTASGRPLVADLGLAKHFDDASPGASQSVSLSTAGEALGTAGYMAPEQLGDAMNAGPAADVFALAAILHECLAGSPAFHADSVVELVKVLEACRPTPIRRLCVAAAPGLERTLLRALARDPRERFPHARDFLRALRQADVKPRRTALLAAVVIFIVGITLAGAFLVYESARRKVLASNPHPRSGPIRPAPSADDLLARSAAHEKAKELDLALADLNALVALEPSARAYVARAALEARTDDEEHARADWDAALRLDPRNVDALVGRADSHVLEEDPVHAIDCADQAIDVAPDRASAWRARGEARLLQEETGAAGPDIEHALALDPKDARALTARAGLRHASGDKAGALADVEAALALAPDLRTALATRGVLYLEKGALELARADLVRVTEVSPRWASGFYFLSTVLRRLGDRDGTQRALDRALQLSPRFAKALLDRGELRQAMGENAAAVDDYTNLLAVETDGYEARLQRAQCLLLIGRLDESIDDSTLAIHANRADQRPWFNRAWARFLKGDEEGALSDVEKAISVNDNTWAYAIRGLVRAARGDRSGALADLERARGYQLEKSLADRVDAALARLREKGR